MTVTEGVWEELQRGRSREEKGLARKRDQTGECEGRTATGTTKAEEQKEKKNDEKGSESKGLEEPYKANQHTHSGRERKWQRNTQKNNAENFRNFIKDAIL